MEALILAGGSGTRLHPITENTPKSLIPLLDRPLVDYLLAQLAIAGIWDIAISLSENMGSQLAKYLIRLETHEQFRFKFITEPKPLGTAGGIKYAFDHSDNIKWPVLVFNADIVSELKVADLLKQHKQNQCSATIASYEVQNPERFGLLRVDEDRCITKFIEKPKRDEVDPPYFINAGVYSLSKEFLDIIPANENVSIERQSYPNALEQGLNVQHFPFRGVWYDVGTFSSYHSATFAVVEQLYLGNQIHLGGMRDDFDVFKDNIYLNRNIVLGKGVRMDWRVAIQSGCEVEAGCSLHNSILFPNVKMERNVKLENCLVAPGVTLPENSNYANRLILGPDNLIELAI